MGAVNLVVVVESVRVVIVHSSDGSLNEFHVASLVAVGAALGVKFLLFLYCFMFRKQSSQVAMLWEDHRNDLFINTFGTYPPRPTSSFLIISPGILMSAGGSKLRWCKRSPHSSHFRALTPHNVTRAGPHGGHHRTSHRHYLLHS